MKRELITAILDGKGLGATVNALAKEGKIHPVSVKISDGRVFYFNSAWAATDWLKEKKFYPQNTGHVWPDDSAAKAVFDFNTGKFVYPEEKGNPHFEIEYI